MNTQKISSDDNDDDISTNTHSYKLLNNGWSFKSAHFLCSCVNVRNYTILPVKQNSQKHLNHVHQSDILSVGFLTFALRVPHFLPTALLSFIFQSCKFQHCTFVHPFPVLHYPRPEISFSPSFSCPANSVPPEITVLCCLVITTCNFLCNPCTYMYNINCIMIRLTRKSCTRRQCRVLCASAAMV